MFDPGKPENRVSVFRSLMPGSDVGCTTRGLTALQTLYLFRAPEKTTADLMADAEREVRGGDPLVQVQAPLSPDPLDLPGFMQVPEHISASLQSPRQGYRIVIGKAGDWAVETRFQGAPTVSESRVLDPLWLVTIAEGQRHGPSIQPAAQAAVFTREALHAQGDELVARSRAPDVFENVTTQKLISVRHKPSGFVCTFDPRQSENALQVLGPLPRGDDVGCITRAGGMVVSYFVTRFPVAVTPQQAIQVYLREVKQMHPDVAQAKGPFLNANTQSKPGEPPPVQRLTAHLTYVDHGDTAYSRLCVAVVNGWVIEQRITAPLAQQKVADLLGEVGMIDATSKMSRERTT